MTAALATALDVDPEWLRTGEASPVTTELRSETVTITRLLRGNRVPDARAALDALLTTYESRDLTGEQRDLRTAIEASVLCYEDENRAAWTLAAPLVDRAIQRRTTIDPVAVGQTAATAHLFGLAAGEFSAAEAESFLDTVTHLLVMHRPAGKDTDWWRLAATSQGILVDLGRYGRARRLGTEWLATLDELGALSGPDHDLADAGVAVLWNTGWCLFNVGDAAGAALLQGRARILAGRRAYALDSRRLDCTWAMSVMTAHPERAPELITVLEEAATHLNLGGRSTDGDAARIALATAQTISGHLDAAAAEITALTSGCSDPGTALRVHLILGDIQAARGHSTSALAAYHQAAAHLHALPDRPGLARGWRDLADRLTALSPRSRAHLLGRALQSAGCSKTPTQS